jgi:hypothetical protein
VQGVVCVFHDPTKADDGQRARRAGGLARGKPALLPADCPDVELANSMDVSSLLSESISQVRRGELDPRVANTIGYLSGILLKALERGVLEERVQKLEIAAQEERQGALNPLEIPDPTRGS